MHSTCKISEVVLHERMVGSLNKCHGQVAVCAVLSFSSEGNHMY